MQEPTRLVLITCIGPTSLAGTWLDGRRFCVELAGWIASGGTNLSPLKDRRIFATARLGDGGRMVVWGELAIETHHLACLAAEQRTFNRDDVADWQKTIKFSNQEAADFIGISLSAWNTYKAGTNPVPPPVAMVCRAALRDPILWQARYRPRTRGRPRKVAADGASVVLAL